MANLTLNQTALIARIRASRGRTLTVSHGGSYIVSPYSEEDGRTVSALIARGVLVCECREANGTGIYALSGGAHP